LSIRDIFIFDEAKVIKNISTDTSTSTSDIRFHINSKNSKPIEILLQQMFSNEFDIAREDLQHKQSVSVIKIEE
jgi:hypothetical protein